MNVNDAVTLVASHVKECRYEPTRTAIQMALEALLARSEPNGPLTLDELREMDGEPVYDWMGYEWFVVSEVSDDEVIMTDGTIFDIDEESVNSAVGRFYRRKPEEISHA